jgi:hypothetical protein
MSGPWHPSGRARVSMRSPSAIGVCQRCGMWYQRSELVPQYEWSGVKLQNLELYVCTRTCHDKPQTQLKTIIIPADPLPIYRPFPEPFTSDDADSAPASPFRAEAVNDEDWEAAETGPLPNLNGLLKENSKQRLPKISSKR